MTVRPVLRLVDPHLRRVAQPVQAFATAELAALIEDLRETMAALDGAGLAAPQIGVPLRGLVASPVAAPPSPAEQPEGPQGAAVPRDRSPQAGAQSTETVPSPRACSLRAS